MRRPASDRRPAAASISALPDALVGRVADFLSRSDILALGAASQRLNAALDATAWRALLKADFHGHVPDGVQHFASPSAASAASSYRRRYVSLLRERYLDRARLPGAGLARGPPHHNIAQVPLQILGAEVLKFMVMPALAAAAPLLIVLVLWQRLTTPQAGGLEHNTLDSPGPLWYLSRAWAGVLAGAWALLTVAAALQASCWVFVVGVAAGPAGNPVHRLFASLPGAAVALWSVITWPGRCLSGWAAPESASLLHTSGSVGMTSAGLWGLLALTIPFPFWSSAWGGSLEATQRRLTAEGIRERSLSMLTTLAGWPLAVGAVVYALRRRYELSWDAAEVPLQWSAVLLAVMLVAWPLQALDCWVNMSAVVRQPARLRAAIAIERWRGRSIVAAVHDDGSAPPRLTPEDGQSGRRARPGQVWDAASNAAQDDFRMQAAFQTGYEAAAGWSSSVNDRGNGIQWPHSPGVPAAVRVAAVRMTNLGFSSCFPGACCAMWVPVLLACLYACRGVTIVDPILKQGAEGFAPARSGVLGAETAVNFTSNTSVPYLWGELTSEPAGSTSVPSLPLAPLSLQARAGWAYAMELYSQNCSQTVHLLALVGAEEDAPSMNWGADCSSSTDGDGGVSTVNAARCELNPSGVAMVRAVSWPAVSSTASGLRAHLGFCRAMLGSQHIAKSWLSNEKTVRLARGYVYLLKRHTAHLIAAACAAEGHMNATADPHRPDLQEGAVSADGSDALSAGERQLSSPNGSLGTAEPAGDVSSLLDRLDAAVCQRVFHAAGADSSELRVARQPEEAVPGVVQGASPLEVAHLTVAWAERMALRRAGLPLPAHAGPFGVPSVAAAGAANATTPLLHRAFASLKRLLVRSFGAVARATRHGTVRVLDTLCAAPSNATLRWVARVPRYVTSAAAVATPSPWASEVQLLAKHVGAGIATALHLAVMAPWGLRQVMEIAWPSRSTFGNSPWWGVALAVGALVLRGAASLDQPVWILYLRSPRRGAVFNIWRMVTAWLHVGVWPGMLAVELVHLATLIPVLDPRPALFLFVSQSWAVIATLLVCVAALALLALETITRGGRPPHIAIPLVIDRIFLYSLAALVLLRLLMTGLPAACLHVQRHVENAVEPARLLVALSRACVASEPWVRKAVSALVTVIGAYHAAWAWVYGAGAAAIAWLPVGIQWLAFHPLPGIGLVGWVFASTGFVAWQVARVHKRLPADELRDMITARRRQAGPTLPSPYGAVAPPCRPPLPVQMAPWGNIAQLASLCAIGARVVGGWDVPLTLQLGPAALYYAAVAFTGVVCVLVNCSQQIHFGLGPGTHPPSTAPGYQMLWMLADVGQNCAPATPIWFGARSAGLPSSKRSALRQENLLAWPSHEPLPGGVVLRPPGAAEPAAAATAGAAAAPAHVPAAAAVGNPPAPVGNARPQRRGAGRGRRGR